MSETVKTCVMAFAFLLLVGCTAPDSTTQTSPEETEAQTPANGELPEYRWGIGVFTDLNGCQYLTYRHSRAAWVTPRMNPDGTQICQEPSNG